MERLRLDNELAAMQHHTCPQLFAVRVAQIGNRVSAPRYRILTAIMRSGHFSQKGFLSLLAKKTRSEGQYGYRRVLQ